MKNKFHFYINLTCGMKQAWFTDHRTDLKILYFIIVIIYFDIKVSKIVTNQPKLTKL